MPAPQRNRFQQVLDGLNKGLVADTFGAPVDLATMAINGPIHGINYLGKKAGLLDNPIRTIDKPFGGSEQISGLMARGGLVSNDEDATLLEDAVRFGSGMVGPAGVFKAPQAAAATGRAVKSGAMALGQKGADMAEDYLIKQGLAKPIFIGENAKTWNAAKAAKAVEMEAAGAPSGAIWKQTQTFRSPDGKLRQEIDDSQARLRSQSELLDMGEAAKARNAEIKQQLADTRGGYPDLFPKELTAARRDLRAEAKTNQSLLDDPTGPMADSQWRGNQARYAYDHPALFEAYPELADTLVRRNIDMGPGVHGQMAPGQMSISRLGMTQGDPNATMVHEMQHAVQGIEGFAPGGSPADMRLDQYAPAFTRRMDAAQNSGDFQGFNKAKREGSFDAYQRLPGEAEARAVEARRLMDQATRQQRFPRGSYDKPWPSLLD